MEAGVRVLLLLLGVIPAGTGKVSYVPPATGSCFHSAGAGEGSEVGGKKGSCSAKWMEDLLDARSLEQE